eukprot:6173434-Pleurochrysis_carterae.AAC.1
MAAGSDATARCADSECECESLRGEQHIRGGVPGGTRLFLGRGGQRGQVECARFCREHEMSFDNH